MIEVGKATCDEVIAEFLRAEIDSSRYRDAVLRALKTVGRPTDLVSCPDIRNAQDNEDRRTVLKLHLGYPDRILIQRQLTGRHSISIRC